MLKQFIIPNRKSYIDGLRGLAMLVVVYGHSLLRNLDADYSIYFVFSNPLNVALFFTISGYLFSLKDGNQIKFFKHIFLRLVVPWLVLGLFPYVNIIHSLLRLISGESLWFMPAIIIAEVLFFYINKFAKSDKHVIIFGLMVSLLGLVFYRIEWLNYAMINRAMTIQWLFVLGFVIKIKEGIITDLINRRIIPFLILYIVLGVAFVICYPGGHYDLHYNRYYFIPLSWNIIILGIVVVFTFFHDLNNVPNWLVLIGQNTLIIYLLHGRIAYCLKYFFSFIYFEIKNYYLIYAVIETGVVCMACIVLGLLANKYFPEIVGLKRRKV